MNRFRLRLGGLEARLASDLLGGLEVVGVEARLVRLGLGDGLASPRLGGAVTCLVSHGNGKQDGNGNGKRGVGGEARESEGIEAGGR